MHQDGRAIATIDGRDVGLADPAAFVGYSGDKAAGARSILLRHNGLHVELVFDPPWNRSMMSEAARLETGMF